MTGLTIGPEEIRDAVERQVRAGLDLVDATRV
jgi:methionine synthase II (cobalamin-independent)